MKQIVCEACGSKDLVKQDGIFVCQHCNTKYLAEEEKNNWL
jgi:DNA-directed RNA polymerase subunit RPC12/RpoP